MLTISNLKSSCFFLKIKFKNLNVIYDSKFINTHRHVYTHPQTFTLIFEWKKILEGKCLKVNDFYLNDWFSFYVPIFYIFTNNYIKGLHLFILKTGYKTTMYTINNRFYAAHRTAFSNHSSKEYEAEYTCNWTTFLFSRN